MEKKLYETLLGRPPAAHDACDAAIEPRVMEGRRVAWEEADGDGPDRLFNRYRRLRLSALGDART